MDERNFYETNLIIAIINHLDVDCVMRVELKS